ncbi:UDP-glucuronosyltransferase 2B10 [Scaptodrosophila lebanonensis]|uniref:UDP-glucuronosyltransferase 2B10 n=1 Tax=Drosophila lebanonensis TaxID=7225 RepID=A0A6J2TEI6_DROLE|nr:UDP-glucuronosyltransferase 2B10 [Scaptodrosophila lebanonensis]
MASFLNSAFTKFDCQKLAIFSYAFPAPYILVTPFLNALQDNGHQLTIISSVTAMPTIEGVEHIRVQALEDQVNEIVANDYVFPMSKWEEAIWISSFFYNSSNAVLSDPKVQSLLTNAEIHFDMIIVEASYTDALFGFAQHFNALLVGISAFGSTWNIDYLVGHSAPSTYEPISPVGYSKGLTLLDKWYNWIYITEEWLLERFVYLPKQTQLFRKYFNSSLDSLHDIRRRFSLILINYHFSLGRARSNVPNLVEVAGMHMSVPNASCDEALQIFMDGATEGVVYFSMGLEITSKHFPKDGQQKLLTVFSKLKQRVIWKCEQDELPNKSDNIYTSPLLPQREVLAHPNVKLFITHGGLLSIIEAAYYGVPMIGLPLYYDQFSNVERMKQAGGAKSLDLYNINVAQLMETITELIYNPRYSRQAKDLSRRFRDQPMSPLETAIWWTEYVLRHDGAHHMRMAEQDLSFMQYYSVDLISTVFTRVGIVASIVAYLGLKLFNLVLAPSHIGLNVHILN